MVRVVAAAVAVVPTRKTATGTGTPAAAVAVAAVAVVAAEGDKPVGPVLRSRSTATPKLRWSAAKSRAVMAAQEGQEAPAARGAAAVPVARVMPMPSITSTAAMGVMVAMEVPVVPEDKVPVAPVSSCSVAAAVNSTRIKPPMIEATAGRGAQVRP